MFSYFLLLCGGFLLAIGAVLLALFSYVNIDDMLSDNLNPIDTCKSLNVAAPIDFTCQLVLSLFFISHFYLFLWNLSLLCFDAREYYTREVHSGWGLYDPTRILRKQQLVRMRRVFIGKMVYYSASVVLYGILALVTIIQIYN